MVTIKEIYDQAPVSSNGPTRSAVARRSVVTLLPATQDLMCAAVNAIEEVALAKPDTHDEGPMEVLHEAYYSIKDAYELLQQALPNQHKRGGI